MAKNRDKESHYKKIINKQKSIIKDLTKKAGRVIKNKDRYGTTVTLEDYLEEEIDYKNNCPNCNKGTITCIDLKAKKLFTCNKCDYRKIK
jgi:ribosomal protein L37AE/L43A